MNRETLIRQAALAACGYYPPRAKFDGIAGPAYKAALDALCYDLRGQLDHVPTYDEAAYIAEATWRGSSADVRLPMVPRADEISGLPESQEAQRARLLDICDKRGAPPDILALLLGLESGGSHTYRDPITGERRILWGADYAAPVAASPKGAVVPYIRGRGWGIGQYTPSPPDRRLPVGDGPSWPDWVTDYYWYCRDLVEVYQAKARRRSPRNPHVDCQQPERRCHGCTQTVCTWRDYVPYAYAGSGPRAEARLHEIKEALR